MVLPIHWSTGEDHPLLAVQPSDFITKQWILTHLRLQTICHCKPLMEERISDLDSQVLFVRGRKRLYPPYRTRRSELYVSNQV